MTFLFIIVTLVVSLFAESPIAAKPVACGFFGNENAMKIIGREIRSVEGEMTDVEGKRSWSCQFSSTDGPAKIHFRLIRSSSEEEAKTDLESIRESNKRSNGFEYWPGVGDDAILHSDGDNVHLVIVRKGLMSMRIKINPVGNASFETVKAVALALTQKMQ